MTLGLVLRKSCRVCSRCGGIGVWLEVGECGGRGCVEGWVWVVRMANLVPFSWRDVPSVGS